MRVDPLRRGWWQTVQRELIISVTQLPSESQHLRLVSQSTQHCTTYGKRFTLASSQQVELPLQLAIPQDFGTTQRIVLPILVTVSCPLCSSHPIENPTQSKLLMFSHHGHIIVTMQVIHYHPDFHVPLFCTPLIGSNFLHLSILNLQKLPPRNSLLHHPTSLHSTYLVIFLLIFFNCFFHVFPQKNIISMEAWIFSVLFTTLAAGSSD